MEECETLARSRRTPDKSLPHAVSRKRTMDDAIATRSLEAGPRRSARIAGTFYLINILTILLAIAFKRGTVVAGNPSATACTLLDNVFRFQVGWALEVISAACSVAVAAYFHPLFAPVNKSLSLLAAFLRVLACAIAMVGYLFQAAPLHILRAAPFLGALSPEQLQAIAYLPLRLSTQASNLVIVVFGFYGLVLGWLIYRSTFLPRVFGVLFCVAGFAGLSLLIPPVGERFFPVLVAVGLAAEVSLTAWLLTAGLDSRRWLQRSIGG